jgi:hypothetical protein
MSLHTRGQMRRHRRLFPQSACWYWDLGKIHAQEHPTQAPTRRTAAPIPKAGGDRRCRGGHIRQDIARQQSQLWQAVAALTPKYKRPVRAELTFRTLFRSSQAIWGSRRYCRHAQHDMTAIMSSTGSCQVLCVFLDVAMVLRVMTPHDRAGPEASSHARHE